VVTVSLLGAVMNETVIIKRPGTPVRDSAGTLKPGPATQTTVENCGVLNPYGVVVGSSSEYTDGQQTVVTRRVLFAPPGTDVRAEDRVIHGSRTYQVIGLPLEFPATSLAHVEASLQEVTG
jgi:hypothetical protein